MDGRHTKLFEFTLILFKSLVSTSLQYIFKMDFIYFCLIIYGLTKEIIELKKFPFYLAKYLCSCKASAN